MYRSEKFNPGLFGKLFHLGAKLAAANRWLKLGEAIPWEKLDVSYSRYFAEGAGRPAKDSRLVCGLLIVKRLKGLSDEDAVAEFMESPYLQAFCGQEYFALEDVINPGILSERRKRLGADFMAQLEGELSSALKADKTLEFHLPRAAAGEGGFWDALLAKARSLIGK